MSNLFTSDDNSFSIDKDKSVVDLVKAAKHRPIPRSTKVLASIVVLVLTFVGGLVYEHKKMTTVSTGGGLSLAAGGLSGAAGFGGGGRRAFAGGGTAASGAAGAAAGGIPSGATGVTAVAVASDVAGTVVSVSATEIVVETLSGDKQTFTVAATTKVRQSTKTPLTSLAAGDIVTIKPDDAKGAKTITVVK